jgi:type II secretory pathway component GspD/PulD (secretin)
MVKLFKVALAMVVLMACVVFAGGAVAQTADAPLAAATEGTAPALASPRSLGDYGIEGLDKRVNLTAITDWKVDELIEYLAHRGGLKNVVLGKGVTGLTKVKFDDVSIGDALEVVLSVNNLAYTIKGGIITIMSDAEYQAQNGVSFYDQKQVRILELKYADAARVATLLGPVKSAQGTVVADAVTGTLILVDTPAKIREMERVAASADIKTIDRQIPTETRQFVLQNAELADIQGALTSILTPAIGAMRTDSRTRSLIITDLPHKMAEIEKLITMFDRRSKQVFIEAKIVQVSLNDKFRLGVNWDYIFEGLDPRSQLKVDVIPAIIQNSSDRGVSSVNAIGGMGLSYKTIVGGQDLNMALQALEGIGETKILSNPHIATMDGKKAEIKVTTREPYSEAKLETGSTNVVGETFQFIDVGVSLDVTPRINDEDMISMLIRPEISSVIARYTGAIQTSDGVPVVRTSYADTSVLVKNGETIIIAGMIENEKQESEARVPVLGRIPLLGILFRQQVRESTNRELIVFLTPRIVSGERPYLRMKDVKKDPKPLRSTAPEDTKTLKSLR